MFGPVSPSPIRLWSWASGQGDGGGAVAQREQRALGPDQPLLEHERSVLGGGADRRLGLGVVDRHGDALAGGEPVELDDDRPTELAPPRQRAVGVELVEASVLRARDAERGGEVTAEALRRLDPGLLRGRPEARDAAERALVGDAGGEHGLGAGDHEVDIGGSDRAELGVDAHGVPVLFAGPGDGVLAPAAADHQHPHQAKAPSKLSLAWASWTAIGYRPVKQALQ